MSVQFLVKDETLYANFIGKLNNFSQTVATLKKYKCVFSPKNKTWEVGILHFEELKTELEDFEIIYISEQDEAKIKELQQPKSSIVFERIPFTKDDLKVPPFKGKAPFENYQLEDLTKCVNRNRFGLFLEQGCGKSWIFINTLHILRKYKGVKKVLIIASPSGVINVKKELLKFTDITEEEIAIGGVKNRRPFDDLSKNIIICNYRSYLLIADEYHKDTKSKTKDYRVNPVPISKWLDGGEGVLILDESHYIANPKARQTKVIHLASDNFKYRYLATGTPADKEEKYYSQLKILDKSLVHNLSYSNWTDEYFYLGNNFSSYAITGIKPKRIQELRNIVEKNSSRRFSDEILDLPEHLEKNIYVEFTQKQKDIYREFVAERLEFLKDDFGSIHTDKVVKDFPKMISAVDNPLMLFKHYGDLSPSLQKKIESFNFEKDHSKIEALLDIVENHADSKIIIWTSHPSVGFELERILSKYNPLIINGECQVPKGLDLDQYKGSIVETFQNDPSRRILIAGQQVFNNSVTLIAANVQIVIDTNFNYTEHEQAGARIRRIGQQKTVYTYNILIDESLDITRYNNLTDKDFTNKKFLSQEYMDKHLMQKMFMAIA